MKAMRKKGDKMQPENMTNERVMSESDMARALNEWMRRFIEEPERFAHEWQAVAEFLKAEAEGKEPDYGERGAAYQFKMLDDINARTVGT